MDRKGFVYLLTVSVLIVIILLVFLTFNQYTHTDEQELVESRIRTMNDFIVDFNKDIHRASYIAGFRAMLALEDYVASNSVFINNTEELFREAFYNGTVNGEVAGIMNESTIQHYIVKVNDIAGDIGIQSNIIVNNITLSQSDPWAIDVNIHTTITVNDTLGVASWSFNQMYSTAVPIYDLRDPLYSHFTNNRIPNTIRSLELIDLVNETNNDTTYLIDHINESLYRASPSAPSFLQRFSNNLSASPYGIESIVNVEALSDQEITVYTNRLKVDYLYFNDLTVAGKICNISTVPENWYIILPSDRVELYNLSSINYSTTC